MAVDTDAHTFLDVARSSVFILCSLCILRRTRVLGPDDRETTMRMLPFLLLLAGATLAAPAAALELQPCRIDAGTMTDTAKARCGTLVRPENPDDPAGRTISLSVALVPALNVEPLPDPLVLFAGGPGQSAIDAYLQMRQAFEPIRRDRHILLVDQRGTGRSNPLDCPFPDDPEIMAGAWNPDDIVPYAERCLESLDADVRYYTTSVAVDDLDAVRAALGFETLNLWGGSYGTRVALHYLRQYPERARSVILDGVLPADEVLGPAIAVDAQSSLDLLFDRCAESPSCNATFPALRETFGALRGRLADAPVTVPVAHPRTGVLVEQQLTGDALAGIVRMSSYAPTTRALLPLMISEAAAGRYTMLAAQAAMIETQVEGLLAMGMHNSVVCAEDAPRFAEARVDDVAYARTYIGAMQLDALAAICGIWPRGPVDDGFGTPVVSDVPVLLLSGEVDPVTPPANADHAAQTLSVSRHIVAPGQGHIISGTGCVPSLLETFVTTRDPGALDTACVERLAATPFFVSNIGPTP